MCHFKFLPIKFSYPPPFQILHYPVVFLQLVHFTYIVQAVDFNGGNPPKYRREICQIFLGQIFFLLVRRSC